MACGWITLRTDTQGHHRMVLSVVVYLFILIVYLRCKRTFGMKWEQVFSPDSALAGEIDRMLLRSRTRSQANCQRHDLI